MIVQGTSVGLDVHALSVVAHGIDEETGKIARARLCPDYGEVLGWLASVAAVRGGKKKVRRLWGDGRGRFRTRGR